MLVWFDHCHRDLPWRRSRDPYAIWVSEIMLQQTRVAAVLDHYGRWMARFPTVEALAAAPEEEVLGAWSGLGYYRRAHFLHQGAKIVAGDLGGKLPQTAAELHKLPGIGSYTSAAIASIAFGEAVAVVDGNVERVLLRQVGRGLSAGEIQHAATLLVDPLRAGDFNQAMMELGATVCLPRNPLCLQCPVQSSCRTRGEHPIAPRKAAAIVDISYGLHRRRQRDGEEVLLVQRGAGETVMPGMWELPGVAEADEKPPLLALRHAIMQTNYRVRVMELEEESAARSGHEARRWFAVEQLAGLPLTGLARKIFLRLGLLAGG